MEFAMRAVLGREAAIEVLLEEVAVGGGWGTERNCSRSCCWIFDESPFPTRGVREAIAGKDRGGEKALSPSPEMDLSAALRDNTAVLRPLRW